MPCVHVFVRDQISGKPAMPIVDGRTISGLPVKHTIEATFEDVPGIKSVSILVNGSTTIEHAAPYCYQGDAADLRLRNGHYDVIVRAHADKNGQGTTLIATQLRFSVAGQEANQPPTTTTGGRKIVYAQGDLNGVLVPADTILDLGGKVWPIQRTPLRCMGGIRNGGFNNQIPERVSSDGKNKFGIEAVTIPEDANGAFLERVTCVGDGYNGLVRAMGKNVRLTKIKCEKGLGWAIQLNGVDGAELTEIVTRNLVRGGISLNEGPGGSIPRKVSIVNVDLLDGGREAPFRVNVGENILVKTGTIDNSTSIEAKDAVQLRGGEKSCVLENLTIIHNLAGGQQPNGRPHLVKWTLRDVKLLGGYRFEAGWDSEIIGGTVVNRDRVVFDGKEYKIGTKEGKAINYGGQAFSLQGENKEKALPKAACKVDNVVIDAAKVSGGIKPKFSNCRDPQGKAIT